MFLQYNLLNVLGLTGPETEASTRVCQTLEDCNGKLFFALSGHMTQQTGSCDISVSLQVLNPLFHFETIECPSTTFQQISQQALTC